MKAKKLLKKAFLILALMGGVNSAWGDATWTLDYSSKSKSWTVTDNQETLVISDYGTVTIAYNNAAIMGNAGFVKFGSNAYNITITLPQGKTFKAGDKLKITGKGGNSGSPACLYVANGVLKTPLVPKSTTDNFDSGEMSIPEGFVASNSIVIRRATSSETGPDGSTTCGGTLYMQKVIYTEMSGPTINTQPVSASYATGAEATPLSVSATASAGSLTYQWYSNTTATTEGATELTGETSSTYTPSTASAGTTYYYCNVSDDSDNVNTDIVSVIVAAGSAPSKPSITGAPVSNVDNGASVTLTTSSTGSPAPTYQWYSNTTSTTTVDNEHKISGATSSSYSPSTTTAGTIYYYVVASNSEGSAISDAVSVTVNARTGCDLTKVIYSNSFDAFITQPTADPATNGTVTAYYMSGGDVPTISSAEISDGATYNVEGTTLTVTAEDGATTKVYDITLSGVSPYTTDGTITFDGTETWVKGGPGFDAGKGWVFRKNADDGRIPQGLTRLYFFVGPAKTVTLTNELIGSARAIKVYVNGELKSDITSIGVKTASIDIPCSTSGNNMIAIVSNQTGGDGAFTKMKLVLTVKSLKVQYKLEETLIKEETLETPAKNIGDSYTVPFRMYVEKDGVLYQTTKNGSNPWYGDAVTLTENHVVTKSLSTVDLGGGTLELFEDLDDSDAENAGIRASNCSAYINKAYTSASNLPAGKYNFIFRVLNINDRDSYIKVGDTEVYRTKSKSKGSWNDIELNSVIIPADGALTLAKSGSAYDGYDILVAIRTGDAVVNITPAYEKSTYVTTMPLDFSDVEGLKAYAATNAAAGVVTLEPVGAVPAGTPLMLVGTASTEYTVPVAASASAPETNLFRAGDGTTVFNGTTFDYILYTDGLFYQIGEGTVATNKAYLHCDSDPTTVGNSARGLRISFGDITGVDAVETAAEAKAQEGKFVKNGKLFIVKKGVKYNAAGQQVK